MEKIKTCLITGATSGIGKITAIKLAKTGVNIILHGRNRHKAEEVKNEIIRLTGNTNIKVLIADLSVLDEVRTLASAVKKEFPYLDLLINNAGGIMNEERETTIEGLEKTLALNFLGPFLLTGLLMDALKNSEYAKVINVSSMAHKFATPDFNDFLLERKYTSMKAYGNAKLYMILFTQELHRRLLASNIRNIGVFALHPGIVNTNFSMESTSIMKLFFLFGRPFLISPEKGAETTLYLATSEEVKENSGKFFSKGKPVAVKQKYTSPEISEMVWKKAERITDFKFHF